MDMTKIKGFIAKSLCAMFIGISIISMPCASVTAKATTKLETPADLTKDESSNKLVIKEGDKKIIFDGDAIRKLMNEIIDYIDNLRKRLFEEVEKRALDADVPAYDWSEDENHEITLTITIPTTAKTTKTPVHGTADNDKNYDGKEPSSATTTTDTTNNTTNSNTNNTTNNNSSTSQP